MTRQKVSRDAVIVAIESIRNKGEEPSINKVLGVTGGSKSTVAAIMREINAEAEPAHEPSDLPALVRAAVDKSLREVWSAAKSAAQQDFDAETRRYLSRTRALENDLADMALAADLAEDEKTTAHRRIEALEAQAARDAEARAVLDGQIRQLETARIADAEKYSAVCEKLDEVREELEVTAALNADLRHRAESAERDAQAAIQRARMQNELMAHFDARFDTLLRTDSNSLTARPEQVGAGEHANPLNGTK